MTAVRIGLRLAAALAAGALLGGCASFDSAYSALHPAGRSAQAIATLWWVMCGGALLIWAGVMAAFVWVARSRERPLHGEPRRWLIWGAGVLPAVVLLPLLGYGLAVGEQLVRAQVQAADDALVVRATARKWHWLFEYPQLQPGIQHRDLRLPAGRVVRFEVVSDDVIHSLWVPSLGGKVDAIPGRSNVLVLQPLQPGRYGGQCAEFCGRLHAMMRFDVVVEPADAFAAHLAHPQAARAPDFTADAPPDSP